MARAPLERFHHDSTPCRMTRAVAVVGMAAWFLLASAGCDVRALHRSEVPASALTTVSVENARLKAHLHDGSLLVFRTWKLQESGTVVSGAGRRLDWNRQPGPDTMLSVPLDSVALFESDAASVPGPMAAITVVAAVHGALSLYCALIPKACFGSCPTFYAWDGERQALVAEGFSASVAPALEATDLDALDRARPHAGRLTLTMTNEALETHVVRCADVLVAERPAGARVLATADGAMFATSGWRAPDVARGPEGDCRAPLAARDGIERTSLADSIDLAARETIECRFERMPAGRPGLAIVARQSLLSTYVFYQTLAWMGRSAGTWLASLERMDAHALRRTLSPAAALGGIALQMKRGDEWVAVGEFLETGPLASDTRLVPLTTAPDGPLSVRLSFTRGMWRLDQVALVGVGERVEPVRVRPSRVSRHGRPDARALACLARRLGPLVTQPGDTLKLVYDLPRASADPELFLESRGYYLEWMRDSWLAEENGERAARLFLSPAASLREMAPEYKKVELEMERAFWGSRYAH